MQSAAEQKARAIIARLSDAGYLAYIAGGAVRDRLLGRVPHDVDVATDAPAEAVLALFERAHSVGRAFGVVLVTGDGPPVEVATFRVDGPYSDGRRPDWVRPTDARSDAARRDFTINGMFHDPRTDRILDYVGGRADLKAGIIRCIGDAAARFGEDRLRLFRAVRFAARFGFEIEPTSWEALCAAAPACGDLAAERVRDELTRVFTGPNAGRGLQQLADSGLLNVWLPEIAATVGMRQPPQYHPEGDVFTHTRMALELLRDPSPTLAWATVLHDVGKPPTAKERKGRMTFYGHADKGARLAAEICERMKMSNAETEQIAALVGNHMRFLDYPNMKRSTRRRFLALPGFDDHLELHRADCLASNGQLATYDAVSSDLAATPRELPAPLLNGDDVMALGIAPGPAIGRLLHQARELQLNGELADRAAALQWLEKAAHHHAKSP